MRVEESRSWRWIPNDERFGWFEVFESTLDLGEDFGFESLLRGEGEASWRRMIGVGGSGGRGR